MMNFNLFGNDEEEEQPVPPIEPVPPVEPKPMEPGMKNYLIDKFGLDKRQKLVDQNAADASGPQWAAGLAALGAGLQGGNAAQAGQQFLAGQQSQRDRKLADFDKSKDLAMGEQKFQRDEEKYARENDPNSDESKIAQSAFIKMKGDPTLAPKLTAAKFKEQGPIYEKMYQIAEQAKNNDQQLAFRMQDRQDDRDFKKQMLAQGAQDKKDLLAAKQNEGKSEGIKALDKDYAKDYNEWTSSGNSVLEKNLQSLEQAKESLKKDPSLTGGLTGIFGDRLTADRVLDQRQKVGSAIQSSLKATLGAAFTDKEGERVLKNAYNEAASPETNIASLNRVIEQLRAQKEANNEKAKYFEQNKTLNGFSAPQMGLASSPSGGNGVVQMQFPDGKVKNVPAGDVEKYKGYGGKLLGGPKTGLAGEE